MINRLFKLSVTAMGFLITGIVGFWLIAPQVMPEIRQANIDQLQAFVETRQRTIVEPALAALNEAYDQVPTVDEAVEDLIARDQQRRMLTVSQRLLAVAITVAFVAIGGLIILMVVRRIVLPVDAAAKRPAVKGVRTAKPQSARPVPNVYQAAPQAATQAAPQAATQHVKTQQPTVPAAPVQTAPAQTASVQTASVQTAPAPENIVYLQPQTPPLGQRRPAHADRHAQRGQINSPEQWTKIR